MTKCTQAEFAFPSCKSRKVTADFTGGNITSFGGVMLLKQADRQLGLTRSVARCIPDARRQASVTPTMRPMIAQRVFGILAAWREKYSSNQPSERNGTKSGESTSGSIHLSRFLSPSLPFG